MNNLEKQNRRNRLEDKLRQQDNYGEIEELIGSLTNLVLYTNNETWKAHAETWQAHAETIQALQNKTLAANALKSLGQKQQSSLLVERAALVSTIAETLKYDRCKTFPGDNDVIDILLLMGKQTNKKFELISVDPNSNKFNINGIDLSLVPEGIKMKVRVYDFSKGFLCLLLGRCKRKM